MALMVLVVLMAMVIVWVTRATSRCFHNFEYKHGWGLVY